MQHPPPRPPPNHSVKPSHLPSETEPETLSRLLLMEALRGELGALGPGEADRVARGTLAALGLAASASSGRRGDPREAWKLVAAWVLRPELPLAAHLVSRPVAGGSGGRGRAQVMSMTNCLQS